MATRTISSSKPTRQLGELLQEQQEPFILEVYLSERGFDVRKNLHLGANFIGCHGYSGSNKFLKSGSQNKSKKGTIPNFPKALKVVCNKFYMIKGSRPKNSDDNEGGKLSVPREMDRNNQESAKPDRFYSASSTTVYNSCSDGDIDEPSTFADNPKSLQFYNEGEKKVAAGKKLQCNFMEDNKQLSPVSVLEGISTSRDNTRPVSSARQKSCFLPKLIKEDSILSASLWNLLLQTTPEKLTFTESTELQDPNHLCDSSSSFSISKRVLLQTKQLLFDCVRELVVDSHEKKEEKGKEYLGSEGIGTLISEKIKAWGKQCGDESNIKQLLETDVLDSMQEWSDYESQKRDIGLLIGNVILEEITSEVVKEMIN